MANSSFREQFGDLARKKGVQESLIPYWANWVMAWGKHLSPRKFVDAGESDVEAFLQHLADQGKAGWQIEQAEAALKLLHQLKTPFYQGTITTQPARKTGYQLAFSSNTVLAPIDNSFDYPYSFSRVPLEHFK